MSITKPRGVRLAKVDPKLNRQSLATLRRIAAGERLTATRTFPHDWHFRLGRTDDQFDTDAEGIIPSHASVLIAEELVEARDPSPLRDFLVYDLTEKGARFAAEGLPADDLSQLDAFPETIQPKRSRRRSAVAEGQ